MYRFFLALLIGANVGLLGVAIYVVGDTREFAEDARDLARERTQQLVREKLAHQTPKWAYEYDVDAVLEPVDPASLLAKRERLRRYIWKGLDPAALRPKEVRPIETRSFDALNGARLSELSFEFPHGIRATGTLASQRGPCLAIWSYGHDGGPISPNLGVAEGFARMFWQKGCDVALFPMAFREPRLDRIDTPNFGRVTIGASHDAFAMLESERFSAFRVFVEPIFATLNYLDGRYDRIVMAGLSGGGWLSVLYAAIDPRVTHTYSVAGSLPFYLRFVPTDRVLRDWGDWEQTFGPLYQIANYFELYLLTVLDASRRTILVYNAYDPCCFSAARAMLFFPALKRHAVAHGLSPIDILIDDTHRQHILSDSALRQLEADFLTPRLPEPRR